MVEMFVHITSGAKSPPPPLIFITNDKCFFLCQISKEQPTYLDLRLNIQITLYDNTRRFLQSLNKSHEYFRSGQVLLMRDSQTSVDTVISKLNLT